MVTAVHFAVLSLAAGRYEDRRADAVAIRRDPLQVELEPVVVIAQIPEKLFRPAVFLWPQVVPVGDEKVEESVAVVVDQRNVLARADAVAARVGRTHGTGSTSGVRNGLERAITEVPVQDVGTVLRAARAGEEKIRMHVIVKIACHGAGAEHGCIQTAGDGPIHPTA
jgi:hypothetical protein